jgi:hypothetical protein
VPLTGPSRATSAARLGPSEPGRHSDRECLFLWLSTASVSVGRRTKIAPTDARCLLLRQLDPINVIGRQPTAYPIEQGREGRSHRGHAIRSEYRVVLAVIPLPARAMGAKTSLCPRIKLVRGLQGAVFSRALRNLTLSARSNTTSTPVSVVKFAIRWIA